VFAEIISVGGLYLDLEWGYVFAFAFFIVVMFVRPEGADGPALVSRALPWIGGAALVALPFVYHSPYPAAHPGDHPHLVVRLHVLVGHGTVRSGLARPRRLHGDRRLRDGAGVELRAVSPWLGIPMALVAGMVLAAIVAYPCFRFRITGHYFALVTLALSGIVLQVITATRDYTGGSLGYTPERYRGGSSVWALQFSEKRPGTWSPSRSGPPGSTSGTASTGACFATRSRRSRRTRTRRRRPASTSPRRS
jgi:ABC-type branched-subunit amino acid transport system permease subunit